MVKEQKTPTSSEGKVRIILINIVRALLVAALLLAITQQRRLILVMSILALVMTFTPQLLKRYTTIRIPAEYEILLILSFYGLLYFADVSGTFGNIWIWGALLQFAGSILLGLVGLTVLYVLYRDKKLGANPFIFAVFTFCFAVAIGALWELFEFGMDSLFGFSLQAAGLSDTMSDLLVNAVGALSVASFGYMYVKQGKLYVLSSKLVEGFVEKNKKLFGTSKSEGSPHEEVAKLIAQGEHAHVEFKSSLRTNLHTQKVDKRMEHSVLKTVNAYLNTHGGTLLVGVDDAGQIIGLDNDQFPHTDALNLHFTNMLKNHIGAEYLPFIRFDTLKVHDKDVLKVDCAKSHKPSFLSIDGVEEFYIRNGPSSAQLKGRALVDYINHQFDKK